MAQDSADGKYEAIPSYCRRPRSKEGEVAMPRYRRDHLRMIKSSLPPTEREMEEYTKDAWCADNLASVRIPDTSSNRWIRFGNIPERFRPAAKQWCRFLLARFSFGHCNSRI